MYSIIFNVSYFVRNFILPNPFSVFFKNEVDALLFNYFIGEGLIYILTYSMVRVYYERGSNPFFGSFSYLFWYIINCYIFSGVGKIARTFEWYVFLIFIIYVAMFWLLNYINDRMSYYI